MPFLSPAKLLVILVVALVVLGPDKLPRMARQIGSLWADFRRFRQKLESEVRGNLPDLSSVDTISQAVRSPLSILDTLADSHDRNDLPAEPVDREAPYGSESPLGPGTGLGSSSGLSDMANPAEVEGQPLSAFEVPNTGPVTIGHFVRAGGGALYDDPRMN